MLKSRPSSLSFCKTFHDFATCANPSRRNPRRYEHNPLPNALEVHGLGATAASCSPKDSRVGLSTCCQFNKLFDFSSLAIVFWFSISKKFEDVCIDSERGCAQWWWSISTRSSSNVPQRFELRTMRSSNFEAHACQAKGFGGCGETARCSHVDTKGPGPLWLSMCLLQALQRRWNIWETAQYAQNLVSVGEARARQLCPYPRFGSEGLIFLDIFQRHPLNYVWTKVFNLLRGHDPSCRGTRHLQLFGHKLCNKGFLKLLAIGKKRFATLSTAVKKGLDVAPLDGRYMPKEPGKQSAKRAMVHDFLYELYQQAAETLPDQGHASSNKHPRQGQWKFDDKHMDRSQIRHLPPGKIMDYLRLCRLEHPDLTISKKIFSSVRTLRCYLQVFQYMMFFKKQTYPPTSTHPDPPRYGWLTLQTASAYVRHPTTKDVASAWDIAS